jgi:predicted nucleotidyltransferase
VIVATKTHLDEAAERYRDGVVAGIDAEVGVVASFVLGSGLVGGFRPGESDLDLVVVTEAPLDGDARSRVIERIAALPLPVRKLELVVYVHGHRPPDFDLNLEAGPDGAREAPDEPSHWFVIDAAIAQEHAPGWLDWFEPVSADETRAAVEASLAWSEERPGLEFALLNGARARHFLEHGGWISKQEATR